MNFDAHYINILVDKRPVVSVNCISIGLQLFVQSSLRYRRIIIQHVEAESASFKSLASQPLGPLLGSHAIRLIDYAPHASPPQYFAWSTISAADDPARAHAAGFVMRRRHHMYPSQHA
jgi:hypothetical protein